MKKSFLLIPALALLSCGGGSGNSNSSSDSSSDSSSNQQQDTATTQSTHWIAYEVAQKIPEISPNWYSKEDFDGLNLDWIEKDNENYCSFQLSDPFFSIGCFPLKSGGYYVVEIISLVCDCPGDYEYNHFIYKDGKLSKTGSLLPKPTLNDFYSNADKFPKAVQTHLTDAVQNRTDYSFVASNNGLDVDFQGYEYDGEYVVPKFMKAYYAKKGAAFAHVNYIWDGEKFVRDPQTSPYEEDLALFK